LTKGRIAGADFSGEKLMQHWPVGAMLSAVIDFFAAYTPAMTHNAFQRARQPPNVAPSPLGIWTPSV